VRNEEKYANNNWLEKLQQESWHLELLVSGFTIFLLLQVAVELPSYFPTLNRHTNFSPYVHTIIINFLGVTFFATYALIVNLILHIFFRGFWIAAIGLRSVQSKIDFNELNYSAFFTKKLQNRVVSLDKLILRLDTIASVIFAFAFLVVFMLFSFALWILFVNGISILIGMLRDWIGDNWLGTIVHYLNAAFAIFMVVTGILYLIDTLSLGFFKKYKWLSKIYYPIYILHGKVTLAGIYRSIYYNLISRFPRKYIRVLLAGFIFLLVVFPFNRLSFYKYYPDRNSDAKFLMSNNYDNLRKPDQIIGTISIPSEIIETAYLPVFIRYSVKDNETLDSLCTDYTPTKTSIWITGIGRGGFKDPYYKEKNAAKLLQCLSALYTISINDSTYTDLEYYFYQQPDSEVRGLKTMIDIKHLPRKNHEITLRKKRLTSKKKLIERKVVSIPFWKE